MLYKYSYRLRNPVLITGPWEGNLQKLSVMTSTPKNTLNRDLSNNMREIFTSTQWLYSSSRISGSENKKEKIQMCACRQSRKVPFTTGRKVPYYLDNNDKSIWNFPTPIYTGYKNSKDHNMNTRKYNRCEVSACCVFNQ